MVLVSAGISILSIEHSAERQLRLYIMLRQPSPRHQLSIEHSAERQLRLVLLLQKRFCPAQLSIEHSAERQLRPRDPENVREAIPVPFN